MGFERGGGRGGNSRGGFGGGRSGGRSGGFGGSRGGDRGGFREKPTMHKAVCDECGKECEVPFRPSNDKPIFCDACFGGKREGGRNDSRSSHSPRSSAPAADYSKQFSEINDKLNKLIAILEKSSTPTVKVVAEEKEAKKVTKKVVAKKAVSKKK